VVDPSPFWFSVVSKQLKCVHARRAQDIIVPASCPCVVSSTSMPKGRRRYKFGEPCYECEIYLWHVPGGGEMGFCSRCCIQRDASRTRGRLAVVTTALPWEPYIVNRVVDFLAGSTAPDEVLRNRRRCAMYVILSSPGSLNTHFRGWNTWDRSDHGPLQYRRDLLEKIITLLT